MLIFPNIKESPIKGLTGLGGGATGLLQAGGAPAIVWSDYLTFDNGWSGASQNNLKAFDGDLWTGAEGSTSGQIEFRLPTGTTLTGTISVRTSGNATFPASVVFYVDSGGSRNPASVTVNTGNFIVASSDCTNLTGFDVWRGASPVVYEVMVDYEALSDP